MSTDAGGAAPEFRYAKVIVPAYKSAADYAETITQYLPSRGNYWVAAIVISDPVWLLIAGQDYAGWTLDGYVIPRLWSGFIRAEEISEAEAQGMATGRGGPRTTG